MDITLWILLVGWIFVLLWVPFIIYTNRKVHPKALFVMFFAEMWERFSYYGMRALLILYMTKVLFIDLAQNIAETKAYAIYGSYTSMVYLFPVLGGMVADRLLGFRKTIIWGGALMTIGHFTLGLQGIEGMESNLPVFFSALALIIVGNGFFKPNISSFLGTFYETDDPRKDGAYSIFYMGVNIGSFLSMLTCGYVGQNINWHYGFGLAGIGMMLGLIVFWYHARKFGDKGLPPKEVTEKKLRIVGLKPMPFVMGASILMIPVCALMLNLNELMSTILLIVSVFIISYLVYQALTAKNKSEGQRLLVVVVLFFFHAIFWALFEQAGGSLTIFAEKNVDRMIMGTEIPASILQSFNPLFIMLYAPLFSFMWLRLNKAGKEPSTPMKFVLGLGQLALGFGIIVVGAKFFANSEGLVSIAFLGLMYMFHTTGELSLSPVGLSMVTKLSPAKVVGFVMGAWYLSISIGNKMAGWIGSLTASENVDINTPASETLNIYANTYLFWGVGVVAGATLLLWFLVPTLKKWMHGIR